MKKILFILITIPLIFSSCEKEEENNNNSSLSLEQTIWGLDSYSITLDNGQTLTYGPYSVPNTNDILSVNYGEGD